MFFLDIQLNGSLGLVYYIDTHTFFDRNYEEIIEIRANYIEDCGATLNVINEHDIKDWYSKFAFEYIAREICLELNIDI